MYTSRRRKVAVRRHAVDMRVCRLLVGRNVRDAAEPAAESAPTEPAAAVRDAAAESAAESAESAESATTAEPTTAESSRTERATPSRSQYLFTKERHRRVHVRLRIALRVLHGRQHVVVRHFGSDGDE